MNSINCTRRQFVVGGTAFASFPASTALRAASSATPDVEHNVANYFAPLIARQDYSGFVILERAGRTLLSRGFGDTDGIGGAPHTADTLYATASIGKMFTRAAALALAGSGKLSLSDPVAKFVPAFPGGADVTVQNLADHKSGLARDLPPDTDLTKARSLAELVTMVAAMPTESKPGARFAYSNNGYRLLARIVELAGQGDYDNLVRELVFEPDSTGSPSTIRLE